MKLTTSKGIVEAANALLNKGVKKGKAQNAIALIAALAQQVVDLEKEVANLEKEKKSK